MTEAQLIPIIKNYLNQSEEGLEKENLKFDFKRKWLNLKDDIEINEFLKDTSSIANTVGLDGFIIIGFDEKEKTYYDARFADCGLKDSNELNGIIIRRVDRLYALNHYDIEINEHKLSIIHIPPSFDKPHVIRNYKNKKGKEEQHRIFVRKGTESKLANKYDIDFMNYDKKNLIPEYLVYLSSTTSEYYLKWYNANDVHQFDAGTVQLRINLNVENAGHRPIAINNIDFNISLGEEESILFRSYLVFGGQHNHTIKSKNLVVQPGQIQNYDWLTFLSNEAYNKGKYHHVSSIINTSIKSIIAKLTLSTGKEITTNVELIK